MVISISKYVYLMYWFVFLIIFCSISEKSYENIIEVVLNFIQIYLQVSGFRFGDKVLRNIAIMCKFQEVFQEI